MTEYTLDYFIQKFKNIPEDSWCIGKSTDEQGRHDVWGHAGEVDENQATEEANALWEIIRPYRLSLSNINDGVGDFADYGANPKDRVLNFLYYILEDRRMYYYFRK